MRVVKTVPTQSTDYVQDGVLYAGNIGGGVLIESQSDLEELLDYYRPGAMAHTAGWKAAWEKSADGVWVNIVGGDDVGGA